MSVGSAAWRGALVFVLGMVSYAAGGVEEWSGYATLVLLTVLLRWGW